jgi:hypothetical protein
VVLVGISRASVLPYVLLTGDGDVWLVSEREARERERGKRERERERERERDRDGVLAF